MPPTSMGNRFEDFHCFFFSIQFSNFGKLSTSIHCFKNWGHLPNNELLVAILLGEHFRHFKNNAMRWFYSIEHRSKIWKRRKKKKGFKKWPFCVNAIMAFVLCVFRFIMFHYASLVFSSLFCLFVSCFTTF